MMYFEDYCELVWQYGGIGDIAFNDYIYIRDDEELRQNVALAWRDIDEAMYNGTINDDTTDDEDNELLRGWYREFEKML